MGLLRAGCGFRAARAVRVGGRMLRRLFMGIEVETIRSEPEREIARPRMTPNVRWCPDLSVESKSSQTNPPRGRANRARAVLASYAKWSLGEGIRCGVRWRSDRSVDSGSDKTNPPRERKRIAGLRLAPHPNPLPSRGEGVGDSLLR